MRLAQDVREIPKNYLKGVWNDLKKMSARDSSLTDIITYFSSFAQIDFSTIYGI